MQGDPNDGTFAAVASQIVNSPPLATCWNARPARGQPRASASVSATCFVNSVRPAVTVPDVDTEYVIVRRARTTGGTSASVGAVRVSINRAGVIGVSGPPSGAHARASTTRSAVPALLNNCTCGWSMWTSARFAIARPGTRLRFDVAGRAEPADHAVTYELRVRAMPVSVMTAVPAPVTGRPVVLTVAMAAGPRATPVTLVSARRVGAIAVMPRPGANQPSRSTITSVVPAWLTTLIAPPAPGETSARFATAPPGATLRFEVVGMAVPAGQATRCEAVLAPTPVRFTTASAPAGTDAPRDTSTTPPAVSGRLARVSTRRCGPAGV